ncbi:hypothetical protein D9B83_12100 [Serratia marcescens]|nr:hypothetical protein D9B83_12100 [Serratia marcescens]
MSFIPAEAALARIALDHATALKATHKARRRGGDSIARKQCLDHLELFASGLWWLLTAKLKHR